MSLNLNPAPTERSAAVPGRIPQLDGLRTVAILLVFLNHTLHTPLTWVGVDIFFVLSGFLITGILLQRKATSSSTGAYFRYFYIRRAFRILPPYYLTLLVFGIFFPWSAFHPWPLFAFFGMNLQRSFAFAQTWNPLPLWSLAVEEQFYFVWPFIILLVSERVLLRLAIAAIVVTPFLRFFCTPLFPTQLSIYMLTPFRADLLCSGALLAVLWKHRGPMLEERCRNFAWMGCVAGFGGLVAAQLLPALRLSMNTRAGNGLDYSLSVLGSFSLLAWALADRGWLRSILAARPMRFLGQISYTMYLVHRIPIILLEHRINSGYVIALIALPITIAYATVSWFLIEKPLIAVAARLAPGKPQASAPAVTV
jgi:peptidoglycan/LPS O-acetylase OafA/YrhL